LNDPNSFLIKQESYISGLVSSSSCGTGYAYPYFSASLETITKDTVAAI